MFVAKYIKNNSSFKKVFHRLMIPKGEARPRLWVKWFVNPFYHKQGKYAVVRRKARLDVLPFRKFELGSNSIIEDYTTINNGVGDVIIGNSTFIGLNNVIIGPVTIGNHVMLAQHITISGLNHNYQNIDLPISEQGINTAGIVIEDDSWIGANVVITAGVTIGKHCVIAAGSVVTKNIPPYCVAVGNPAKVIKCYNFERKEWEKVV
jgi:acetyltransferase-like isoleucine patch superfamily enzyme